jgi:hypothetical protein
MRFRLGFLTLVTLLAFPLAAQAAPIVDGGWFQDYVDTTGVNSAFSPYVLALSSPVTLSITDAFVDPVAGDIFQVYDNNVLILTTAFNTPGMRTAFGDNGTADNAWVSALYTHGQITLAPGPHSLTIQATSLPGGGPAGFFVRLDTAEVPEPASIALWSLVSVGAAAAWRRKKLRGAAKM